MRYALIEYIKHAIEYVLDMHLLNEACRHSANGGTMGRRPQRCLVRRDLSPK